MKRLRRGTEGVTELERLAHRIEYRHGYFQSIGLKTTRGYFKTNVRGDDRSSFKGTEISPFAAMLEACLAFVHVTISK